jgi:hypothetical protein
VAETEKAVSGIEKGERARVAIGRLPLLLRVRGDERARLGLGRGGEAAARRSRSFASCPTATVPAACSAAPSVSFSAASSSSRQALSSAAHTSRSLLPFGSAQNRSSSSASSGGTCLWTL